MVPRFGINQGLKQDGSVKVRAVDHFSWSSPDGRRKRKKGEMMECSVNGRYGLDIDMKHDHLDDLFGSMQIHWQQTCAVKICTNINMIKHFAARKAPALMKADIDSAFRRIPVRDDHRWAAAVTWLYKKEAWTTTHIGMPFGAAASGIAWHKIGHLLSMIGREMLGLPLFRYVDDYFAVDRRA